MVTIDGTDTRDWGFVVGSIQGGLDVLKKKAQDAFNWPDSDGEQYYTTSEDYVFNARKITLRGHVVATRDTFEATLATLITNITATGLRAMVLPYSTVTYSVYCRDGIKVNRRSKWGNDLIGAEVEILFIEPEPDDSNLGGDVAPGAPGVVLPGDGGWRMDDYDLQVAFGIRVQQLIGNFTNPPQKVFPIHSDIFTNGVPYYQGAADVYYKGVNVTLRLFMYGATLAAFAMQLRNFKAYLFDTGLRTFKMPWYDITFEAYCKDGAQVKMITKSDETAQAAEINLKLRVPVV